MLQLHFLSSFFAVPNKCCFSCCYCCVEMVYCQIHFSKYKIELETIMHFLLKTITFNHSHPPLSTLHEWRVNNNEKERPKSKSYGSKPPILHQIVPNFPFIIQRRTTGIYNTNTYERRSSSMTLNTSTISFMPFCSFSALSVHKFEIVYSIFSPSPNPSRLSAQLCTSDECVQKYRKAAFHRSSRARRKQNVSTIPIMLRHQQASPFRSACAESESVWHS